MDKEQDPLLSAEDALKAENTLLKMKLGLEHGMQMTEMEPMPPDLENSWLKSVYEFEQHYKNAKRVKLFDYLGQPEFKPFDTLTPEQVSEERRRLEAIMAHNNVALDCLCQYDDATIYRFITEELFNHEMDEMRIPGMTWHFTYEEFHPNHDYDLRHDAKYFAEAIYEREWHDEYDIQKLGKQINFCGKEYDRPTTSGIIKAFQDVHEPLEMEKFEIKDVSIATDLSQGNIKAFLSVIGKRKNGDVITYDGDAFFHFIRVDEYWYLDRFDMPGLSG